jgi:hypothetical protein
MTFERPTSPGPEPAPSPAAVPAANEGSGQASPALRLQILSTEHWSLLASRSLAWNESFSRAGMFLTTLTGAIVALALVAQASDFDEGFRIFALVILPVVLLVGIGTLLRLGISNDHDARCVIGMNRIRSAYMELAPELERYFVMGTRDDMRGRWATMGIPEGTSMPVLMLSSTPILVTILDAIIIGAILAIAALQLEWSLSAALALAAVGFAAFMVFFIWYARRRIERSRMELPPLEAAPDAGG